MTTDETTTIFIGLGSNVGDREQMVGQAARQLAMMDGMRFEALSPLYESPAMLPENAPDDWDTPFINAVGRYQTDLRPRELMKQIMTLEVMLGKQFRGQWGPREIDIDLLCYGALEMRTPSLQLPHPGIESRDFVLLPWRDIAPDWHHPDADGQSIAELAAKLTQVSARPLFSKAA